MFTGIVAETGKVSRVERSGQGIHLKIHARRTADRIQLGDSLAAVSYTHLTLPTICSV